ncbi:alkene reductase [Azospirillum canadense]|uniref:alkene reductase n=1 Tax=Azospirillum canadense TaxID=403962 RepID=UPI002226BF49|nr:alkene reductase [Azospirillum canadense]MCW2239011.1 2,4-dienoyl-CoA reductase-like NADH-dependent reductase (Old Yellow Enzyme family) [Azospirillum canadense]
MPTLFDPITLGAIQAPNRLLMAPMTRARGTRDHVPTPMMANYYAQRASAGLIISEAIGISQQGLGWPYATGIWSAEQIAGWRRVTEAVHGADGRIIAQLWHMGRVVHPSFLGGAQPVSASVTTAPGHAHTYAGKQPYTAACTLRRDEIPGLLADFQAAARNAMAAGFDGVQLHASNGYLIDQFLRDSANHRDDAYGGPIPNRIRFLREVTQAVADAVGADRTGVRLSPNGETQGVRDSDPLPLFIAAAEALSAIGIAHLELREPPLDGTCGVGYPPPLAPLIRPAFKGPVLLNSDFDVARAQEDLGAGTGDAVTFGRPFIANPDFPRRIAEGLPLAADDRETWFTQGPDGYLDYPSADGSARRQSA